MKTLKEVIAYWRDCLLAEGSNDQSFVVGDGFALSTRSNAILFEGEHDPFLFGGRSLKYIPTSTETKAVVRRAMRQQQELYFGYPLVMFFDEASKKHKVAPLIVLPLFSQETDNQVSLCATQPVPVFGTAACAHLGLTHEEVAALNEKLAVIFTESRGSRLKKIVQLLQDETDFAGLESINPLELSRERLLIPYQGTVIRNKAVIYASEPTTYNMHVLRDLETLCTRDGMEDTSLGYVLGSHHESSEKVLPVLPFAFDEYQVQALKHIVGSDGSARYW